MKLWSGRFTEETIPAVDDFTSSIRFDYVLAAVDIQGSLAHVKALEKSKILTSSEVVLISDGLETIKKKIQEGNVTFSIDDEDIHMNIERLLQEEIGSLAGKLHTGRSRNDQVALDLHLYLREHVLKLSEKIIALQTVLIDSAEQHLDTLLPGYTHLQRAQPVRLAHHLLAYVSMLQRDIERLQNSWPRINTLPLGAGALAGSGFFTDREYLAELLGFERIYENSMDAVSDRDFIIEFLSNASLIMMHLSRLSEELILWSTTEFNFVELADTYCTGSSMMPQKKNPDVPELIRAKTGRVYGALMNMLTVMKGLPLTYNKDLQEDKEGLFDTLKTLHQSLEIYAGLIQTMKFNVEIMFNAAQRGYANATELADYLVHQDIPFREAHEITGKIVRYAIEKNLLLGEIPLDKYQEFSAVITENIYEKLLLEHSVEARGVRGGTARKAVIEQLNLLKQQSVENKDWLGGKLF